MDEDDELPGVPKPPSAPEGVLEPESTGEEDPLSADQYPPAPDAAAESSKIDPKLEDNIAGEGVPPDAPADAPVAEPAGGEELVIEEGPSATQTEKGLEDEAVAMAAEGEGSAAEEGAQVGYSAEISGNVPEVAVAIKEEGPIAQERGLPTGHSEKDAALESPEDERGDAKPVAKEGLPVSETEVDTKLEVPVAEPKGEEGVAEEGSLEVHMAAEVETKVEEQEEATEVVTETEVIEMEVAKEEVTDLETVVEDAKTEEVETEMGALQAETEVEAVKAETEIVAIGEKTEKGAVEAETEIVAVEVNAEMGAVGAETEMGAVAAETEIGAVKAKTEVGAVEAGTEIEAVEAEAEMEAAEVEIETVAAKMDAEIELPEVEAAEVETETEGAEAEMDMAMDEMEMETEVVEPGRTGGGKRKRGRYYKAPARTPQRKKVEEDVCFICFDGGELVLCDRRGCPKAYHPSCVNRDEAFFRAKGRWNCGWHICSRCEKNSYYMCYTCTYSLCKGCIKDAVILCVRGNKGFCEACMRTVLLIEKNERGSKEMDEVDFNDKNSWEYLFKDYWTDLKGHLGLTLDELEQAKNPWKASDSLSNKQESPHDLLDANNEAGSDSEHFENQEASKPKRSRRKRLSKTIPEGGILPNTAIDGTSAATGATEWASKELLEFVMHMKDGDGSVLSQFDVQALLLEYIKRNKLRDPRRKSQIICDSRLENLFGKARVGHFEMLKLLESHFLIKEDSQADDIQGSVVDTEASQLEGDGTADTSLKGSKDRKRKMRKKDDRGPQSNVDDYAAIDMHNINLIYLRRNLMEDLIAEGEKFHEKVVGSFVRIRISGSVQKQDIYRLVQVVGTSKAAEPYKVGKRTTDFMLEILNLNKIEVISIDIISNQDFTEEECNRLRQSIKCGLINRLTVGDVLEKAMALHAVRVNDWMEAEIVRLSHLRDRASEKGRRKELRECVEKLQLLKTAGERRRRLDEIPEVHADPNMDPSHESEEDEEEDMKQEVHLRPRGTSLGRRGREPISPGTASNDSWSGSRKNPSKNWELNRSLSDKDFLNRGGDAAAEIMTETSWNHGRDRDLQQTNNAENLKSAANSEASHWNGLGTLTGPPSALSSQSAAKISETDKIWHYQDPSGKVQGPFSLAQLRKWSNTGYFPNDLRVWKTTEKQDGSILLTDLLSEYFPKDPSSMNGSFSKGQHVQNSQISSAHSGKPYGATLPQGRQAQGGEGQNYSHDSEARKLHSTVGSFGQSSENWRSPEDRTSSKGQTVPSLLVSGDRWGSGHGSGNDLVSLPSPTPSQTTNTFTGGKTSENKQAASSFSTPLADSALGSSLVAGGNGVLPSAPLTGQTGHTVDLTSTSIDGLSTSHASLSQQSSISGNKEHADSVISSQVSSSPMPMSGTGVPMSSGNALQSAFQSYKPNEMQGLHANINPQLAPDFTGGNSISDAKQAGADLPKFIQSVASQTPNAEAHGWAPTSVSNSMPVQQPGYSQWAPSPSPVSSSSFNAANSAGTFPTPGFASLPPSNPWRPLPGNQLDASSNVGPSAPQSLPWGMGTPENTSAAPNVRPEHINTSWGPMSGHPNMPWGGPAPANANTNWGGQGSAPGGVNPVPVPGVTNMNWGPALQGIAPGSAAPGPTPAGGTNMNWGAVGQGLQTGNANMGPSNANMNWGAPNQPGNANPGWVAPNGNSSMWGSDQNQNGDRFNNQRDRNTQGGDGGYGGGRPRNRQSSFGGGGPRDSRPHHGGQRLCPFYKNGHCKKGSNCNLPHS